MGGSSSCRIFVDRVPDTIMFAYLSKKIAVLNEEKLCSLSWNTKRGLLACGGESGLLKIIKTDSIVGMTAVKATGISTSVSKQGGEGPSLLNDLASLSNQTLHGHAGRVTRCAWNPNYNKLASADDKGLIIVWTSEEEGDDRWYEEMINKREESIVKDLKWTEAGDRICIAYLDGTVIVGSVEGTKIWGREFGVSLEMLTWSPDGKNIIFSTAQNELKLYDAHDGNYLKDITAVKAVVVSTERDKDPVDEKGGYGDIVSLDWYCGAGGYFANRVADFVVAFCDGLVRLAHGIGGDICPITVKTNMTITSCRWNANGHILAVGGFYVDDDNDGGTRCVDRGTRRQSSSRKNVVKFYDPTGTCLQSLKVPGAEGIAEVTWDGSSPRLAVVVGSCIYFATLKPRYKWAAFGSNLVYSFSKRDTERSVGVTFWNMDRDEKRTKFFDDVLTIRGAGEHCFLITEQEEVQRHLPSLLLFDNIGTVLSTKRLRIKPRYFAMSPSFIAVTDDRNAYIWNFNTTTSDGKNQSSRVTCAQNVINRVNVFGIERIFDVHDDSEYPGKAVKDYSIRQADSSNVIKSICLSDKMFLVSKGDGVVNCYQLPSISALMKINLSCVPSLMELNCNSTKIGIINTHGDFFIRQIATGSTKLSKEGCKKDTWMMKWSEDDPHACAIMEKTKLYIIDGDENSSTDQSHLVSNSYLMKFSELEIKCAALDDIVLSSNRLTNSPIETVETPRLRDAKDFLNTVAGDIDVMPYFSKQQHPRLLRLLADYSLTKLDFKTAEKAFVMMGDYRGVTFTTETMQLEGDERQRAEVAQFLGSYDEAEQIYFDLNRSDLVLEMRSNLGDWARVVRIVKEKNIDDETLLQNAHSSLGDSFFEEQKWSLAAKYYKLAKDTEKVLDCLYRALDFNEIEIMANELTSSDPPLLKRLSKKFYAIGFYKQSASCHEKLGDNVAAIDVYITFNRWNDAVRLASKCGCTSRVHELAKEKASVLLKEGSYVQAIELFRQTGNAVEAAGLLYKLAKKSECSYVNPSITKKLYILAAYEVESHRHQTFNVCGSYKEAPNSVTLDEMMNSEIDKGYNFYGINVWHAPAAHHYFSLAHWQLYNGDSDGAMKTAIRCTLFEDILQDFDLYSLLALAAHESRYFGVCSKAFTKLESLTQIVDEGRSNLIQQLATSVFTSHPLTNEQPLDSCYTKCLESRITYDACTITGRCISQERVIQCNCCCHFMIERKTNKNLVCPLCHSSCVDAISMIANMDSSTC